jgi:hypothetical protein
MKVKYLVLTLIFPGLLACSSAKKRAPSDEQDSSASKTPSQNQAKDSSVDIDYILGRDHYRFFVEAHGGEVKANTYLGRQILEQGMIDANRYPDFLVKASLFIDHHQKYPSQDFNCRAPFKVTVRIGQESQSVRGCRSTEDGGALSKLVRDGEFLLYSKN